MSGPAARAVRVVPVAVAVLIGAASRSAAQQAHALTVQSQVLADSRRVRVTLPPNYDLAKQRYPVVYLMDGHVRAFVDMAVAAANYDVVPGDPRDYAMPSQIVVAVEHKNRGEDLGRNADAFMRALVTEIVPQVERQFRTNGYRVLMGHSLGGRFALMASCRAPGVFPSVIAISPGGGDSTAYRQMTECLTRDWSSAKNQLRQVFVSSGEREARIDEGAKRLRDFLKQTAPAHVRWKYLDGPDLAHTETPYVGIPAGLRFVWDRSVWELPAAQADAVLKGNGDPMRTINEFYEGLTARAGVRIPVGAKWLEYALVAHQRSGDAATAERIARRMVDEYPEVLAGYARLADLLLVKNEVEAARRAITDAVAICDKLDMPDETERALKRKVFTDALARIGPGAR